MNNEKTILGLIGSPRKLGNCEVFIKEISKNIKDRHKLELLRLPSLRIKPCRACYRCIMGESCPQDDDMKLLLESLVKADAIIVASPVYFLSVPSSFKRILDRGFLFYDYVEKTEKKPCILISFYGLKEGIGVAPQALLLFAYLLGLDIKANLSLRAALPGEIVSKKSGKKIAKDLASLIFSDRSFTNGTGCPFCGCEIVRIQEDALVCTLCHGHFNISEDGRRVKIKEGEIPGSRHIRMHKKWLKRKKLAFVEKKNEIMKTLLYYEDIGEWIRS